MTTIDTVIFQDPHFTTADCEFLKQRGYSVLPYTLEEDIHGDTPFDHNVLSLLSNSAFLYTPYLYHSVAVEAVCAIKPTLYFGDDLFTRLTKVPWLVSPL